MVTGITNNSINTIIIRAASLTGLSLELQRANLCQAVPLTNVSAAGIDCTENIIVTFTVPCVDVGAWSLRISSNNNVAYLPVQVN